MRWQFGVAVCRDNYRQPRLVISSRLESLSWSEWLGCLRELKIFAREIQCTRESAMDRRTAGPGSSSPIVRWQPGVHNLLERLRLSREEPGDMKALKLHLLCFDRQSGKQQWDSVVDTLLSRRRIPRHVRRTWYASHTPVSDGQKVYVYFGKRWPVCI